MQARKGEGQTESSRRKRFHSWPPFEAWGSLSLAPAATDLLSRAAAALDPEGRHALLNAVANQLRYPNAHTHFFSVSLLAVFAGARCDAVQEAVTRVLLERLIVNRPHPWGLLVTFIELIKNPRYAFWGHGFTRCAAEVERLFESVARSCMGPASGPPPAGQGEEGVMA